MSDQKKNRGVRPRAQRHLTPPPITYPEQLPVSARREEIAAAIRDHQVVIVAGETGSGKTTQLPKICMELGRGVHGMIGHTQPRRIAARSVAERICFELGVPLGGVVGYQVRFTEEVGSDTMVKLMTDGILLAEIQSDPELLRYDTLIIDEAHERSLNIDFILGYLAQLLPRRPELKVIVTSATIDTERFAAHFGQHSAGGTAPIVEVSGRTYPVEIRYEPLDSDDDEASQPEASAPAAKPRTPGRSGAIDQVTGIVGACQELMAEGPGDILVFLSGEGEIRDTQQALADELGRRYVEPGARSSVPGAAEVLPLFARLSAAEQHRIFESHVHRRIILATNIAETSLTVPGIRYVVDPGTARISRYSNKTKVQRLPIEPVSQASANQRAGRCGRVADGICIRLYSEEDFAHRDEFTQPEIQRTSLASVILQMISLGLGNISKFPFIDPPEERAVRAGMQLLEEIGALDTRSGVRMTRIGRQLARLPLDPRLGRMLIEGQKNGCASEVLVLVAALSVQDVRERPTEKRAQADQLHARFTASSSDFLAYLTLWRYLHTQQRELSGSQFRRTCRAEFLNYLRYREWSDVVHQLQQMARPLGLDIHRLELPTHTQILDAGAGQADSAAVATACRELGRGSDTPEAGAIHRSMLVGLLSNLGNWSERSHDYAGARGTHFVIWPGSGLHRHTPDWVMAAELVETSRLFARTVAAVEPHWIEPLAKHLSRKSYSEPYWSSRKGAAMCKEKVTLYGMTLVADRNILLSSVGTESAKDLAREMFIRHALVEGDWRTHHKFLRRNKEALEDAVRTEEKLRKRGMVADDQAILEFYTEKIPTTVVSSRHFDSWWKKQKDKTILDFTPELLLGDAGASSSDYPSEWVQGDFTFGLEYTFNPGQYGDGVTITIPVTLLPQVEDAGFDWLVPGMREDLVTGTIRALPKQVRRKLVPAPDVAQAILPLLDDATGVSFREAFSDAVFRLRDFWITKDEWAEALLPPYLQMHFRIRSERGAVLAEGTNLAELRHDLAPRAKSAVEGVVKGAVAQALDEARQGLTDSLRPSDSTWTAQPRAGGATEPARSDGTSVSGPVTSWPANLPVSVETTGLHGMVVRGYPALVRRDGAVYVDVLSEPAEQVRDHRLGVIQLLKQTLELPEARITSRWNSAQALGLAGSPYPSTAALVDDLQLTVARNLADQWAKAPLGELRDQALWDDLCASARNRFEDAVYELAGLTARICAAWAQLEQSLRANTSITLLATVSDLRDQLRELMPPGFLFATPQAQLPHLIRYLNAGSLRLEKAAANPSADDSLAWQIQDVTSTINSTREEVAGQPYDPAVQHKLEEVRWMVEEFRVSLFAQQLGTQGKVSAKRITKLLATI